MKTIVNKIVATAVLLAAAVVYVPAGPRGSGSMPLRSMQMSRHAAHLLDSAVNDAISQHLIPGAVVSVVKGDRIAYLKAFGNKSVVPDTVKMTDDVMFDLASCSKCVGTTLSFMQLIEQGKVRLHDPVSMYIPGFAKWIPDSAAMAKGVKPVTITVEHLLTHSSGIDPYLNVNSYVKEYGESTPDSLVRYIAEKAGRNFEPGTEFMYSCLNFISLQAILERVTGERLCDYAEKNVFAPLGLKHTMYLDSTFIKSGIRKSGYTYQEIKSLCAPTEVQADGMPLLGSVHDPLARRLNGGNSGNAGVFSDARDLSVICAAIMNGGEIQNHRILSPAAVELMSKVPEDIDPEVGRALGWDHHSSHAGPRGDLFSMDATICHTGYTGTSIVIDLKRKTAVIILAHRVHPEDTGSLARLRAVVANIVAGANL